MRRVEERATVNAAPAKVFDYVADFTRHGEWSGHGLQVTKESDGPIAVGTTFATVAKQFGTQRERSTVTDLEPGKKFGWDSVGALGRIHHWFEVSGDGGSTTLTKGADIVEPKFVAKVMGWKLSKDMPKALRADLDKIKSSLEQ